MKISFGFNWKKSPAHLELLSKFIHFNSPDDIYKDENWCAIWKEVLGEHPQKAIKRFLDEKVLVSAGLHEFLDYKFKVTELKSLCKERGLRVSGKKADLISNLVQTDEKGMLTLVKGINLLSCSEGSRILAQKYLDEKRIEKTNAENLSFEYLKNKQFEKATKVMLEYEAKQVFPRGLGVDWRTMRPDSYTKELTELFKCKPKILESIPDEKMEVLRIAAGFMQLWSRYKPELFSEVGNLHPRFDNETSARMLWFYISSKGNLDDYRKSNIVKSVEVLPAKDSCNECKKLAGIRFPLKGNIPELPHHKCTHEKGCRCCYIPVTILGGG